VAVLPLTLPPPLQAWGGDRNTNRHVLLAAAAFLAAGGGGSVLVAPCWLQLLFLLLPSSFLLLFPLRPRGGRVLALLLICVLSSMPTLMRMTQRQRPEMKLPWDLAGNVADMSRHVGDDTTCRSNFGQMGPCRRHKI
jgi:hypothetical protein